ncbi:MAG TPA: AsmA-like C-terminal region-containing protein, partial [Burkholderiales bacterium]|nr:AsmA-like C-terminal region-containing protein [Burkholderiales bacterium]
GEREGPEEPPGSLLDTYRELEKVDISLRELQLMDADLQLTVGRWLSLPGEVRDAQLGIRLKGGVLSAPVQATIAGVPLRGEARVDGAAQVPSFDLQLGALRTQLGGLAALLAGVQGVQGSVGKFLFHVSGRGENLGALTRTVDVRLAIGDGRLSYGNIEGGRPVELRLDRLDVTLPGGRPLQGRIDGALLGEPFRARIAAGDLPTVARTLRSPLEITARATGAELEVKGVLAQPQAGSGTDIQFRLVAPRSGDVGRWLGLSPKADAPARLQGSVRIRSDQWRLDDFLFRIGRSAIAGQVAQVGLGREPLIQARLNVDQLDLNELERVRAPAQAAPDRAAPQAVSQPGKQASNVLDIPILPRGIDLTDADIDVNVKRVAMSPADVVDASFKGRIREGRMDPSPFSATYAGVRFTGALAVDLRGNVPEASVWVAAGEVDVGRLLSTLKITDGLDARVEALRVQLIGRGSRLGEMLEKSALDADLDRGSLTLRDPGGRPLVAVALDRGVVRAPPGKPVSVTLDGTIDQVPVAIRIGTGAVRDVVRPGTKVPFSLEAQAAGARLDLQGKVTMPIQRQEGELTLRIAGERFDSLNRLARVELPPWGPWSLGGRFVSSERGYEVPDLALRVGESRLDGRGGYTATGVRPRVDVALTAPRIQLDDFKLGGWSPFEKKKQDQPEKKLTVEEMRAKAKEAAAQGQKLLSRQTLQRLDAYLDVQVDEVLSGTDRLGNGSLHAQLANGRLDFGPAKVNVPGGSALLSAAYEPSDTDVTVQMRIDVDRFDYGILARRIKPGTDVEGLFSLNFQLDSRAPTIDALLAHADGRVDFAVWPRNMRSGIFDLWAVNVFLALVPAVDPAKESKVNCAVGRFDLRDGKLTHDAILMDTSRMRVAGEGRVDFGTETLRLRLAPKAKEPQFFSLATPIQVSGTLTNFKIGVAPGGVAETTVRFLTSVFVVPIEKLTKGRPPRDGSDLCTNAMRAVQRTQ